MYFFFILEWINKCITKQITQNDIQHTLSIFRTYLIVSTINQQWSFGKRIPAVIHERSRIFQMHHFPGVGLYVTVFFSVRETVFL